MRTFRFLKTLLFPIIMIGFVVGYLFQQQEAILPYLTTIKWMPATLAVMGFAFGMSLLPLYSALILNFLKEDTPVISVYHAYMVSQVAKYLPGSIWSLPARIYLYQRAGISITGGIHALTLELFYMIVSGFLMSALTLGSYLPDLHLLMVLLLIATGVLMALRGMLLTGLNAGRFGGKLSQAVLTLLKATSHLSLRQSITLFVLYSSVWLIFGAAMSMLMISISFDRPPVLVMSGLFAAGWVTGFLVVIAPGGIGVRDTILASGAAIFVAPPLPFLIAVLARLCWIIGELTGLGLSWLMRWGVQRSKDNQRHQIV